MTRLSIITLTFLILMSGPAHAKWEKIGDEYAGIMTQYIAPSTIRRNGNLVQMWDSVNFKTIQTAGNFSFFSSKGLREYDCAEERIRVLAVTWFSGQMSTGSVVQSASKEYQWNAVSRGSVEKSIWEAACGKQ